MNSSKVYSGISSMANLDKSGSIILSQELAVAKTLDVSSICLVLLILVSKIIPVSMKCNKAVWSEMLIFSNSSINKNLGLLSNN